MSFPASLYDTRLHYAYLVSSSATLPRCRILDSIQHVSLCRTLLFIASFLSVVNAHSFRARTLLNAMSLPQPTSAATIILYVMQWELHTVHYCRSLPAKRADLLGNIIIIYFNHASWHESYSPVIADD